MKHALTIAAFALLALVLTPFSSALAANTDCYSQGVRVGVVQKFSRKGIVNKSWEGELVMAGTKLHGGYKSGTSGGDVWAFSVIDPNVAAAVDNAAMSGNEVALRYCQVQWAGMQTDTGYRITQVVERK
jgi:hypothetical protein